MKHSPTLLFIGAHPDDETFMMGATLAKYAAAGVAIHVVSATRGEHGLWGNVSPAGRTLGQVREMEHRRGLKKLGVISVSYLDEIDGTLSNDHLPVLIEKTLAVVDRLHPDILVGIDEMGISGHIDHIVMSRVAGQVFSLRPGIRKLYHYVIPQYLAEENTRMNHGIRVWGVPQSSVTTEIDIAVWNPTRISAALDHETQKKDTDRLIPLWENRPVDHFILRETRVKTVLPETDLLAGL